MAPMLSTFGGGSVRGFGGGRAVVSASGGGADDVFPYFSGWGSSAPITNLTRIARVAHGVANAFGPMAMGKIVMEPGGNRMWLARLGNTTVYEYNLSTPYMISTMGSYVASATYSSLDTTFAVDPTGEFVMAGGRNNATTIWQLSTPWDLMGSKTSIITGLGSGGSRTHWGGFGDSGTYFGLYSDGSDYFRSYQNSTPYNYAQTGAYSNKTNWAPDGSGGTNSYGGHISADGKALCITDWSSANLHFWEFGNGGSQPWDASALQNRNTVQTTSGVHWDNANVMGLQLVRAGGGSNTQGYAYGCDSHSSGYITQLGFTWQV